MTALLTVALMQCYCLSIGCMLWRRITAPETLPLATFSLGKCGIPLSIAAVLYAFWSFFRAFWPTYHPVMTENFNWASVLFVGSLVGAGAYSVFVARSTYFGLVENVQGRKMQSRRMGRAEIL